MAAKISIGTAWVEAAAFVRRERRLIAPVVLALIVLPAVIAELVKPDAPIGVRAEPDRWSLVGFAALLIGMVAQLAVMRLAMGSDGSVGAVLKRALRRIWAALGALLLFGMIFALAATPLIVLAMVVMGSDAGSANRVAVLFVMIALAAMPRVLPVTALAMEEDGGPWSLLKRVIRLTRNNYWRLLGFFVLFLLASFALAAAVTVSIGSLAALVVGPPEPMTVSRLIVALAAGLVQGVVLSVYAAMTGRVTLQLIEAPTSGT